MAPFATTALLLAVALEGAGASLAFRAPAVPLAVSTPFASIWSFDAGNLAGSPASFWHGEIFTMASIVRVDSTAFTLLGGGPASSGGMPPAMAVQVGFPSIGCTTSNYSFVAGAVALIFRFTTPHLPSNFEVASRPFTHIEWSATSIDGQAHAVQVFFACGTEVVAGVFANETVEWDRPMVDPAVTAMRIGQVGQKEGNFNYTAGLLRSTEPHQSQDYGWAYLLAPSGAGAPRATSVIGPASAAIAAFLSTGALPGPSGDAAPPAPAPSPAGSSPLVAALAFDLGTVASSAPATARAVFAVDEVVSVLVHGRQLAPYWRRAYGLGDGAVVPSAPLADSVLNASAILAQADALDASILADAITAGGEEYAAVAQLIFRQTLGANGYAWNGTAAWGFQKEISSDGDLSTLDVLVPSSPLPLFFQGGEFLRVMLESNFFQMASFDSSLKYTQPCAAHSLGKWPVVDLGNGGCSMPMESSGDALLMAAGVSMSRGGESSWLIPYLPILRSFADFCSVSLPFPARQDYTDDFSGIGELGNVTNLALKCILGIGAQGYIEQTLGNTTGAAALYASARSWGEGFGEMAWVPSVPGGQAGHFKLLYNTSGNWDLSYGLLYNAVWARLLGVEYLIPSFYPLFTAHFQFLANTTVNSTWCPALSSVEHDGKWDWNMHTAALMYTNGSTPQPGPWSEQIISQTFFFANNTNSRFPLTDHPECVGTFPPTAAADRARPVMGALFLPLLVAKPPPAFVSERAKVAAFAAEHLGLDPTAEAWAPVPTGHRV
jgi:hypothetical protein